MKSKSRIKWLIAAARAQATGLFYSLTQPSLFRRAWVTIVLGVLGLVTSMLGYIILAGPHINEANTKEFSLEAVATARFSDQNQDANAILDIAEAVRKLSMEFSQSATGFEPKLDDRQFAIFSASGELIGASADAPIAELRERAVLRMRAAVPDAARSAKVSSSSQWIVSDAVDKRGRLIVFGFSLKSYRSLMLHLMVRELPHLLWQLLVFSLVVWAVARFSLRPIARLAEEIKALDSTRFAALKPSTQYVELREVVAAINDRTQAVQHSVTRERDFFSNAAHELRTPLAVVSAQAHSVAQTEDPILRQAEGDKLQAGVARTATLVSRLLNLARLDGHASAASYVDLGAIATECCSTHALRAIRAKQELALEQDESDDPPNGRCEALAAAEDVQLIIENLVDNAIRYAGEGAAIVVRTGYVEQYQVGGDGPNTRWAMVSVSNTGAGFTQIDSARAFTRFQRGSRADQSSGSGLGLAIVKAAAERYGGHVRLIMPVDGVGACVEVRLPPKPKSEPKNSA